MTGHKQIIALRMRGLRPAAVFLSLDMPWPAPRYTYECPERQIEHGMLPTVYIASEELAGLPDLRFLTGCRVHVHGERLSDTLLELADAAVAAGAAHVLVLGLESPEGMEHRDGQWKVWN